MALGVMLGVAPAMAQDQPPADDTQAPPAATEQPAAPEAMPSEPTDPAEPIPGDTSQADPAMPPAAEAPSEPTSPPSAAEAPQPIEPVAPKSAEADSGTQFLSKQETSDYLASNLIGESVYNAQDEVIGDINDLVSDESGKFVAVLIGAGGFLGMGEKDVALRFEDLKFTRDEDNDIKVVSNISEEMLASAPDYERLSEQDVTVGATDTDSGPQQ
jgi:hypothetical protein